MKRNTHLTTIDITLVGIFSALWVILNLTLGPLGFVWFRLPILCDFAVFLTLLLTTWATGKFGTASLVGILGSITVSLARPSPHIIGFAASAILFDALMLANHHKLSAKAYNMTIAALATIVSAYFAGLIIGIFFTNQPLDWATLEWSLTIWGGWHLIGGIMGLAVTLPIVGILEKANVRGIRGA